MLSFSQPQKGGTANYSVFDKLGSQSCWGIAAMLESEEEARDGGVNGWPQAREQLAWSVAIAWANLAV